MKGKIFTFFAFFSYILSNITFANLSYKNKESDNKNLFFETNQDIKFQLEITPADVKTFNKTLSLLNSKKWEEALSWADSIKSEHLKDSLVNYALWKKYTNLPHSSAKIELANLLDFIKTHEYLPNIKNLKMKAETMYLNEGVPYQFVDSYFSEIKPVSTNTAIRILRSKYDIAEDKKNPKLSSEIINTFYDYDFSTKQFETFFNYFSSYLTESAIARKTEELLWDKKYTKAQFLIKKLNIQNRNLYNGIIKINNSPKYINSVLRSIPNHLRENELLLYTRLVYEHNRKDYNDGMKILLSMKEYSNRPDKWYFFQKFYARRAMANKEYEKAYFLSINNSLKSGTADYADAQWTAGWLALEFLNEPKNAYYHFYQMYNSVSYPVSKARGAYWAGRSMEKDGNIEEAVKWYDIASQYTLYFYGQLSLHAKNELLGIPSLIANNPLPKPPVFTKQEEQNVLNNDIVKIAYLVAKHGNNSNDSYELFLAAIKNSKTKGEKSAIFEIVKNTEKESLISRIAKQLSYQNIYFVDNLFPLLNIINLENPNYHLVHSIIKQESGFHISAKSRVGASGFMQLMPDTAKEVARKMKVRYNSRELRTNPAYNILLGSYYINSLIRQFDGSQILAIASYNAGPSAVNRWIKENGDPRRMTNIKDIVNWLELIGYAETRNYVQRIIESSITYEYVLERFNSKQLAMNSAKNNNIENNNVKND